MGRVESIQSDSSGFADGDITTDHIQEERVGRGGGEGVMIRGSWGSIQSDSSGFSDGDITINDVQEELVNCNTIGIMICDLDD